MDDYKTLSTTLRYYAHWIPKETKEGYVHLIDAKVGKSLQVTSHSPILTPDSEEEQRVRWQMR